MKGRYEDGQALLIAVAILIPLALASSRGWAADKAEAKGEKVEHKVYNSYFVSNKADLKGETSFLALIDAEALHKVLLPTPPNMRMKREYLPKDVFDAKLVVAVIKRGNKIWDYKVEKVTADKDTLYVQYTADGKDSTATHASPLIVTVDKGKLTSVVFIENGEKVGTATIGK